MPKAKGLVDTFDSMRTKRQPWQTLWQETAELVLPQHQFSGHRLPGTQKKNRLFDTTAVFANEMFAATMASQLINPSLRWFDFRFREPSLNDDHKANVWLGEIRDFIQSVFSAPESGFSVEADQMFLEAGAFGTGAFFVGEKDDGLRVRFAARPLSEIYIRENQHGKVDSVGREFEISLRQFVQEYGKSSLPDSKKRVFDRTPDEKVKVLHIILPREDVDTRKIGKEPWASFHVLRDPDKIVREAGFNEFPFMVPRILKAPGEIYGRGPGTETLPDNRMLQRMMEVTIRGAQKTVDPPLMVPDDGFIGPIRTTPSGVNTFRAGMSRDDRITPLQTGARPDIGMEFISRIQESVVRGFFLDQTSFQPPEPRVTATAIMDQRDERFRRMTPLISRLQTEFLAPLLERTFQVLARARQLPERPEGIPEDADIDLVFTSPAVVAQMVSEADNISRFIQRAAPMLESDPLTMENLDRDKIVRTLAKDLSLPMDLLNDPSVVEAARDAAAREGAQQRELGTLQQGAQASRDLAEASEAFQQR